MAREVFGFALSLIFPFAEYETILNGSCITSSYENNSLILWYLSQTVIIHAVRMHIGSWANTLYCQNVTVSQLPDFELLIRQRGEQKFIHPSLTQSHLVPSQLWILGHRFWPSVSNTAWQIVSSHYALTGDNISNNKIKSVLQPHEFKGLTTLYASNSTLRSPTLAWLLRSIWNHLSTRQKFQCL